MLPKDASILIVLLGAIGDVVRGSAVPSEIKKQRPDTKITWLVEPASKAIAARCSAVDEVIVFERKRWLTAFCEVYKEIRARKFDVVLDMQRHSKSGLFSFLSRAPIRVGFHSKNSKEFNWLFNNRYIREIPDTVNKGLHYLAFLEAICLNTPEKPSFSLKGDPLSSELTTEITKAGKKVVGLVLGSTWETKDWPPEGYSQLIDRILSLDNTGVLLLGDLSRKELGEKLLNASNPNRVKNLAGKTTLGELVSVVSGATLCVGPDSGPGHIAAALGVPYVSIFGPTSPERTAPLGSSHLVVRSSVGCSPCYRRVCPGLNKVCMRLVTGEQVFEKVRQVLTDA